MLAEKPEGKRAFGTHRGRWENYTEMVLKEAGFEVMD
jgi:hypothetical protein